MLNSRNADDWRGESAREIMKWRAKCPPGEATSVHKVKVLWHKLAGQRGFCSDEAGRGCGQYAGCNMAYFLGI